MTMSVTMSKKTLFIKGIALFIFVLFIMMSAIPVTSGKLAVKVNRENITAQNNSIQETFFEISPSEQWNKTFGGNHSDRGFYCEQTSNEGYIITGHTWSYGNGGYDVWLIRTDADGNEEWNKTFGGENDDVGISVHFTIDDGYIIAGSTNSYGAGNSDVWLIKTDAFGNEEWNITFGKEYNDWGWSVHQTIDNGSVITGII